MLDLHPRGSVHKRNRNIREGGLLKVISITNIPAVLAIVIPGNLTLFWAI